MIEFGLPTTLSIDTEAKLLSVADGVYEKILREPALPFSYWKLAPDVPGVYFLFEQPEDSNLVYVGVSVLSVLQRFKAHNVTLENSIKSKDEVFFRSMAMNGSIGKFVEDRLISTQNPLWNGMGFGSTAPRKNQKPSLWKIQFGKDLEDSRGMLDV